MHQPYSPRISWLIVLLIAALCGPAVAQSTENPLQLRPDHATASVTNIDRAVRWYEDMLGFKVVNRGDRPNGTRFADLAFRASASAWYRTRAHPRHPPTRDDQAGFNRLFRAGPSASVSPR